MIALSSCQVMGFALNKSATRGLLFGSGFGCLYAVVVLVFSDSGSLGLAVLGGLGGAVVGAVAGYLIAVVTSCVARVARIRDRWESVLAACIAGASTLMLLVALSSISMSTWQWSAHLLAAGVAGVVAGLVWPPTKTVAGKSQQELSQPPY